MAGKAHPADNAGKGLIRDIFSTAAKLESSKLRILYLENYDWDLGEQLTNGVDVWLNTPLRPYEASGTSGMKAALNGVPSLSVLDGWWVEGCAENITGWAIENSEDEAVEAERVYNKLENSVAPAFADKARWAAHPPPLHRHQWHLLQHPSHARPVRLQRLLSALGLHRRLQPGRGRRRGAPGRPRLTTQEIRLMQAGDLVENFTLPDQDGNPVSLSDFAGKPVVLFFYPKADTPGCTIEACGFRDHFKKLQKAGVIVLGISRDTVKAQKKFAEKYDLPYPLLADADQTICNRFGVIKPKNMYGKTGLPASSAPPTSSAPTSASSTSSTRSSPKATPKKSSLS